MKTLAEIDYKKGEDKATMEAVWTYLLDHSEITPDSTLFVKFHVKSKHSFLRRIEARMKGLYRHPSWAESLHEERRQETAKRAIEMSERTLASMKIKKALVEVKALNEKRRKKWWHFWK